DIQRYLDNEPVIARPPSPGYRFQKLVRRNRLVFAAAAAVAIALLVALSVSTWQVVKTGRAQHAAEVARGGEQEQRLAAQRNLYVANMNLAQQAWEQHDVGLVRQLLEETATHPSRGFEWYYWQRQMHLDLCTLRGHLGKVHATAFSPDGERIV